MDVLARMKALKDELLDLLVDSEVEKRAIVSDSPHRVVELERRERSLQDEVDKLEEQMRLQLENVPVGRGRAYRMEPGFRRTRATYESTLAELGAVRLAIEQERNVFFLSE